MSGEQITTIIASVCTALIAMIGVWRAWMAEKKAAIAAEKIEAVARSVNGMKHELVEEVRAAAFAQGKKEEKDNPTATNGLK